MLYLICYDISSNSIRHHIAKQLLAEGYERLQLSVYCGLRNPKANRTLWKALTSKLAKEPDAKFYVIRISKRHFRQMDYIGAMDWEMEYLLGTQNSLFI